MTKIYVTFLLLIIDILFFLYAAAERLKLECASFDGVVTDTRYAADVTLKVLVPEEKAGAFAARIRDLSAGAVEVKSVGESFRAVRVK